MVFCKLESQKVISDSSINSVLEHLKVTQDSRQSLDTFKALRNEYFDKISDKFSTSKLNPIYQIVMSNVNKFDLRENVKVDNFLRSFYASYDKILKEKLDALPLILHKQEIVQKEITNLKTNLLSEVFEKSEAMRNDFEGTSKEHLQYTQKHEKKYFDLMESLNDFFQTFEKQIEVFHTHLVQEIVFELRKRVQGNINPKMTSIFMSSEVNKRLAFITDTI